MYSRIVVLCLALVSLTAAQISSTCNPLASGNCPANPGLSAVTYGVDFSSGPNGWIPAGNPSYGSGGAAFSVAVAGQAPTLYSDFYILFGYVEAKIKAAPGVGIVSSLILISDALDEIDWEWLGGTPNIVQTNYYGKGNTGSYDREQNANVGAATSTYHTYAIDWTSSYIKWIIDGTVVRTLNYGDANGGKNFPQTPCRIGVGPWAGGASPQEGTRNWAGGPPDFSQGPFTMYAQTVNINNYNPAKSYVYGDQSGNYQSIKLIGGAGSGVVGSGSANVGGSNAGNGNANANANANAQTPVASPTPSPTPSPSPSPSPTTSSVSPPPPSSSSSLSLSSSSSSSSSSILKTTTISVSNSTTTRASTSAAATTTAAALTSPSTAPKNAASTVQVSATLLGIFALAMSITML